MTPPGPPGADPVPHPAPQPDAPRTPRSPGGWNAPSRALVAGPSEEGDAAEAPPKARPEGKPEGKPQPRAAGAVFVGRGSADPVRVLLHRHRDLCARAVDPLEIAAGLEAHGMTDRTAARFRHRDVFALAEELYARVPREHGGPPDPLTDPPAGPPRGRLGARLALGALHLVPGALCAATAVGLARAGAAAPGARVAAGAGGAVLVAAALWLCLARGPLKARGGGVAARLTGVCRVGWLVAFALGGDWLLAGVRTGVWRPFGAEAAAEAAVVLALAVAPAAWCARWFARRARRRLAGSRGLAEFAAGVRPLLAGTVALFLCALPPLVSGVRLALPGRPPEPAPRAAAGALPTADTAAGAVVALCVVLFVARLLAVHGYRRAAALGTAAACLAEAAVVCGAAAGRLPGGETVGEAVARASAACGPVTVPAAVCGATALALLAYAFAALARASAHGPGTARPTASEPAAPAPPLPNPPPPPHRFRTRRPLRPPRQGAHDMSDGMTAPQPQERDR
ncbi:hypothetical protein ABT174_11860 [Streptomyces sparsogenes]|uniref:hypothetical protein n=1 Tax=Streptomyces sparsogenes TaxID=67365 RepID=UPI00331AB967